MADALVRLKVESQEYDAKIKRAQEGLTRYADECRKCGGTLEYVEKETLEYVKSLGQMDTVSKTAKGKVAELSNAYTELAVQYKQLTDAEKNSPYGQTLQGSLGQLRGRISELKGDLSEAGKEIQTSGGFIDSFADSLGQLGPIGQMAGKLLKGAFGPVGIAIAAVVGIIKELVDAFKRNENAMAAVERAAAPFKAIWQQIQRVFDRLVPLIADAIEGISNGIQSMFNKLTTWTGKLANTNLGKKLGLDTVYAQLKKVSEAQDELTKSNQKIADSENALNKIRRTNIVQNAKDEKEIARLREAASNKDKVSAAERVKMLRQAGDLEEGIMKRNVDERKRELEIIKLKNSLTQSGKEDLEAEAQAEAAVIQAETEYYNKKRAISRQLQAAINEDNKDKASADVQAEPVEVPVELKITEGSLNDLRNQLKEAQSVLNDTVIGSDEWAAALEKVRDIEGQIAEAQGKVQTKTEETVQKVEKVPTTLEAMGTVTGSFGNIISGMDAIKNAGETLQEAFSGDMDAWDAMMAVMQTGIGTMQTVMSVIESINALKELSAMLSAKNAAASMAEGTAAMTGGAQEVAATTAATAASATKTGVEAGEAAAGAGKAVAGIPIVGPVLAVAAIAAVLAAVLSATSKAKSAGNYATGGIIPGNSFTGDQLTANVNSGELILNRAQQAAVAGQLQQANPLQNAMSNVRFEIDGTRLIGTMNNTIKSKGGRSSNLIYQH